VFEVEGVYMVHFAKEYPDLAIGQQVVAQIPWGHNILLLQKLENLQDRLWYAHKTIENGWSRSVLMHWLDNRLHKREGKAITIHKMIQELATGCAIISIFKFFSP
jgi:predicted nuclease of restriction endonuclease-like (RecB) superfamily